MTAQTEPAVLSAGMALYLADLNDPAVSVKQFRGGSYPEQCLAIVPALRAIATKEVICKSSAAEAADRARMDDLRRLIGIGVMYCLQSDSSDAREWASGIPLEFIGGEPKMKEPPK